MSVPQISSESKAVIWRRQISRFATVVACLSTVTFAVATGLFEWVGWNYWYGDYDLSDTLWTLLVASFFIALFAFSSALVASRRWKTLWAFLAVLFVVQYISIMSKREGRLGNLFPFGLIFDHYGFYHN